MTHKGSNAMIRSVWFVVGLSLCASTAFAAPKHAIAMLGEPAMAADYKSLPYANPDAPQGGTLRQAMVGTFDSLNPFIIKGNAATGLRTYVFESIMYRNYSEPFSLYCLLCESIDVSDDRQTFTFKLRPDVRFSDGSPLTTADIIFTMETLRGHGRSNFKNAYAKIKKIETPDAQTLVFHQEAGDRELPLLLGLMPVFSKTSAEGKDFESPSMTGFIGTGPYVVADAKADEIITYKKNPDYWGKAHPINRGLWNFDTLRFDYYRDANTAFEAFKKGDADIRTEADPVRWTSAYDFPAVADGRVIKEKIESKTPAPTTGFAFNTRRKLFEDVKVREALAMAFDFEWLNANLFGKAFKRTYGYFGGSAISSEGKAADAVELAIIGTGGGLRRDYLDGTYKLPVSDGSGKDRKLLRKVVGMLGEAGWTIQDSVLKNSNGDAFAFTITITDSAQEKVALAYKSALELIGIAVDVKKVDAAQFSALQRAYDYDMIPVAWYNSLSPGNEQKLYFGSEGKTKEGTRNYPGIADPRVDAAIDAMFKAADRASFESAVRAEDRLLVAGHYIVPFYDAGGQWVARWNYIGRPDAQPLPGFEGTTLWHVP
jgi:peptide/nickel transport system substrate-binding protein